MALGEAQDRRKPDGFQGFATTSRAKFALSLQDAKTALIRFIRPLNRAESPLVALFFANLCGLWRHDTCIYGDTP